MTVTMVSWKEAVMWGCAGLLIPLTGWALFLLVRRSDSRDAERADEEPDEWRVPELTVVGASRSLLHRWDPRFKVCSLLFFAFCAVSVQRLPSAMMGLLIAVGTLGIAGIPFRFALKRILAMVGFLGMFFLVMPLTVPARPSDTVIVVHGLEAIRFNPRGLWVAALIWTKATAVAVLMEPLLRTTPFPTTVRALAALGVSKKLCQMLLIMYRYVFVFRHEMARMWVGMSVRGFRPRTNGETFRVFGNFLGMLFVRSLERTQRVHEAMVCRGYQGEFPMLERFQGQRRDWLLGGFWFLLGVGMILSDRWGVPHLVGPGPGLWR